LRSMSLLASPRTAAARRCGSFRWPC
jgi:hypothetical protein